MSAPDDALALADQLRKAYARADRIAGLARAAHRTATTALPEFPPIRFAVTPGVFAEAWPAGGAATLFHCAATGHGGGAEVVALFVKQAVLAEELRTGGGLAPGELLGRANRALLAIDLPDPPFVSAALVRVNRETGQVTFARAGLANPVCEQVAGGAEEWPVAGPLLGVFDAEFPTGEGELRAGDVLRVAEGVAVGFGEQSRIK